MLNSPPNSFDVDSDILKSETLLNQKIFDSSNLSFDVDIHKNLENKINLISKKNSEKEFNNITDKNISISKSLSNKNLKIKIKNNNLNNIKIFNQIKIDSNISLIDKNNPTLKKYFCEICQKIYSSYPALYTHSRNKHNIVHLNNRGKIFKEVGLDGNKIKYNYDVITKDSKISDLDIDFLIEKIKSKILMIKNYNYQTLENIEENKFICTEKSENIDEFFEKDFNSEKHIFIQKLIEKKKKENTNLLPLPESNPCIDDIFINYFILFSKIVKFQNLFDSVALFILLFREHLNINGWDLNHKYISFGFINQINKFGLYTQLNTCHFIPDLVNDFIEIFVNLDIFNFISISIKKDMIEIVNNFCSWILLNKYTNLKLISNEDWLKK